MGTFISLGQFNRNYFFILGSILTKFILAFISGFTPNLSPNDPIFLFGIKTNLFIQPLIKNCIQYFSIASGSIILGYYYKKKIINDDEQDLLKNESVKALNSTGSFSKIRERKLTNGSLKSQDILTLRNICLIYFLYFFGKISISSLDDLGYNRVKYWPLELIFLYLFSKKFLGKNIYRHQFLSLIIISVFCTICYSINSFFPYTNKKCPGNDEECNLLKLNIYKDIQKKLEWYFIPIIIVIYIAGMASSAYSGVKTKWLTDFKYVSIIKVLFYLGILGLIFSVILLFLASFLPCKGNNFIKYICQINYDGKEYYDNFRSIKNFEIDKYFYLDIFILLPIFLISSFINIFCEVSIINKLDPLYLIPIDSTCFLIYEFIDYFVTFNKANPYRNIKFFLQVTSNTVSVIFCSIYLEIIELHFYNLDKNIKRNIIIREEMDKKSLLDIPLDKKEENTDKNEKEKYNKNEEKDKNEDEDEDDELNISFKGYNFKIPKK